MKFATLDKGYLEERKAYSERTGPRELWSVIDHWPLYCGIANLGRFMAISDLLRSTLDVPGHVAEFGSWRGANLLFMTKLLKIFDPHGCKVVHCFESFEGLATFSAPDGAAAGTQGAYQGNHQELQDLIALYGLQDDVAIHKGWINETLPPLLKDEPALAFSFVYCDTDLFEPTKLILDALDDRMVKGGLFVFDEWNDSRWPGEGQAVQSFLKEHGDRYAMRHVKGARQPTLVLEKTAF